MIPRATTLPAALTEVHDFAIFLQFRSEGSFRWECCFLSDLC